MQNTNMEVGTLALAMVGRNEVKVEIVEIQQDRVLVKSLNSGKVFQPRRLRAIEPAPRHELADESTLGTAATETLVEPTIAEDTPPRLPVTPTTKKLSLFNAAIRVLEVAPEQCFSVKELVGRAIAQRLWTPGKGKTPDLTLYAAIIRDIATKENPRIVRADQRGKFRLNLAQ